MDPPPPYDGGFVCFVAINPCMLSANRVDFGLFFCFINFPIIPPHDIAVYAPQNRCQWAGSHLQSLENDGKNCGDYILLIFSASLRSEKDRYNIDIFDNLSRNPDLIGTIGSPIYIYCALTPPSPPLCYPSQKAPSWEPLPPRTSHYQCCACRWGYCVVLYSGGTIAEYLNKHASLNSII